MLLLNSVHPPDSLKLNNACFDCRLPEFNKGPFALAKHLSGSFHSYFLPPPKKDTWMMDGTAQVNICMVVPFSHHTMARYLMLQIQPLEKSSPKLPEVLLLSSLDNVIISFYIVLKIFLYCRLWSRCECSGRGSSKGPEGMEGTTCEVGRHLVMLGLATRAWEWF